MEAYREGKDLPKASWPGLCSPNPIFSPLSHSGNHEVGRITRKERRQGPKSHPGVPSDLCVWGHATPGDCQMGTSEGGMGMWVDYEKVA